MPSRGRVKQYSPESIYHAYNRGVEKRHIFLDQSDYAVFLNLMKRHLSIGIIADKLGREYKNYYGRIELLAYCLMPTHYHLLIYQRDDSAMEELMRSVMISYTGYFNKKYERIGGLYQDRYRARLIVADEDVQYISAYIHTNPGKGWAAYPYSSYEDYLSESSATWVQPGRIIQLFVDAAEYEEFVKGMLRRQEDLLEREKFLVFT